MLPEVVLPKMVQMRSWMYSLLPAEKKRRAAEGAHDLEERALRRGDGVPPLQHGLQGAQLGLRIPNHLQCRFAKCWQTFN